MLNGYHLRRRSIPPQLMRAPKVVFPSSLININEPVKSEALMKHFIVNMKKRETRKVVLHLLLQFFYSYHYQYSSRLVSMVKQLT